MGLLDMLFGSKEHEIDFPESLLIQNWEKIAEMIAKKYIKNEWNYEKYNTKYTAAGSFNAMLNVLESQGGYEERINKQMYQQWADPNFRYNDQGKYYRQGKRRFLKNNMIKIFCVWPVDKSGRILKVKIGESEWQQYVRATEYFKNKIDDSEVKDNITAQNLYLANYVLFSQLENSYKNKTIFDLFMFNNVTGKVQRIKTINTYPEEAFQVFS